MTICIIPGVAMHKAPLKFKVQAGMTALAGQGGTGECLCGADCGGCPVLLVFAIFQAMTLAGLTLGAIDVKKQIAYCALLMGAEASNRTSRREKG